MYNNTMTHRYNEEESPRRGRIWARGEKTEK